VGGSATVHNLVARAAEERIDVGVAVRLEVVHQHDAGGVEAGEEDDGEEGVEDVPGRAPLGKEPVGDDALHSVGDNDGGVHILGRVLGGTARDLSMASLLFGAAPPA